MFFWDFKLAADNIAIVANKMELLDVNEGRSQGKDLLPVETHIDKDELTKEAMNH